MNSYLIGALVSCCVLLSSGMIVIFIMAIFCLHNVNKILKKVNRLTTLLNFEAKVLAPLFLGKKLFFQWWKKKCAPVHESEEEEEQSGWIRSLFQGAKWTAAALLLWSAFRNKD